MSFGILKFKLPDEQDDFNTACRAQVYKTILWEFDQNLREKEKYSPDPVESKIADQLREEFWKLLKEYSVNI